MFIRVFLYRLKSNFRDPIRLFWMLIFPYIMAVVFALAIMPMGEMKFEPLKVAVVEDSSSQANPAYKEFFDSISAPDAEQRFLDVTYMDEETAIKELNAFNITGFYTSTSDGKLELSINRSEIDQTILRSIADSYNQISFVIGESIQSNPTKAMAIMESLDKVNTQNLLQNKNFREEGNPTAVYFFALIGMFIMYAMNFSLNEVTHLQGDLSTQGARVLVSPAPKSSLLLASISSAFTIQMLNSIAFMVFLDKVIGFSVLHFGLPLWGLLILANITAIAMGATLATFVKGSFDVKISTAIAISMICSFFAGLMNDGIRAYMINNLRFVARLNPAELIADSFYSMYFFQDQARVLENCLILGAITLFLAAISIIKIRRSSYASI